MIILGINDSNSAAAVTVDGRLVAAVREERFDRIKFSPYFPVQAIRYCLKEAGARLDEVDHVVFSWNPGHDIEPVDSRLPPRQRRHYLTFVPNNLLGMIGGDKANRRVGWMDQALSLPNGRMNIHYAPHHATHAAAAFFPSPYVKAAILAVDAYGENNSLEMFLGEGNRLTSLGATPLPHSLGHLYAAVTQYLGYRANQDEWKVMGLAAYGQPTYYDAFARMFRFDRERGQIWVDLSYFAYFMWNTRRYSDDFVRLLGPERDPDDELEQRHWDIACSFQRRFEDVVLELCAHLHEITGLDDLCLAGGVAMNSKMNGRIQTESPFRRVWCPPGPDEGGTAIGACYYYWNHVLGRQERYPIEHDYWGPDFSDDAIREALDNSLVPYEELDDPEGEAAASLATGNIICWFQGRMEFGQRALGARSILGDPRQAEMKARINALVKHREWYRPFAPSVLEEHFDTYFACLEHSPFMQKALPVRPEKRAVIPAVVHEDGTARVQTVSRRTNPRYWAMIERFRQITGVPVVLNTSFNDNDEPIVCTPKEALRTFFGTGLHELYIGKFRIRKGATGGSP